MTSKKKAEVPASPAGPRPRSGGSYLRDPKTGSLMRTPEPEAAEVPDAEPDAGTEDVKDS